MYLPFRQLLCMIFLEHFCSSLALLSHLHFVACSQFSGSLSLSFSLSVPSIPHAVALSSSRSHLYLTASLQLNVSILWDNTAAITFIGDNTEGTDQPNNINKVIQSVVSSVSVLLAAAVQCRVSMCEDGSNQSTSSSFIPSVLTKLPCDVPQFASEANYELWY